MAIEQWFSFLEGVTVSGEEKYSRPAAPAAATCLRRAREAPIASVYVVGGWIIWKPVWCPESPPPPPLIRLPTVKSFLRE